MLSSMTVVAVACGWAGDRVGGLGESVACLLVFGFFFLGWSGTSTRFGVVLISLSQSALILGSISVVHMPGKGRAARSAARRA